MIEIQPLHTNLSGLFHRRLFRIPQYQRAYSWQTKQRDDLFADLRRTQAAGGQRQHFMATLVGLRRETRTIFAEDHQVIEIVDGQQRITTLILLLKAITNALNRSDTVQAHIGQDLDATLVKPDEASLLLLQTNHDSGNYFADYLRGGKHPAWRSAKTLADRELLMAMEECETFVEHWVNDGVSLVDLVSLLKNRLTFVFHEIGDEGAVYTVFEVLNSRGLDVSWFDRVKSMLMAIVFETDAGNKDEIISEVHQLWTDIYRCVGLRIGLRTESLRFAATLRADQCPSRPLSEEEAAMLLQAQSKGGPAEVLKTTRWLKAVTEAVDRILADNRRNAVTRIVHARLVATAVNLRVDIPDAEKTEILRRWENVTFRIFGMFGKDARTAVGQYSRLAWRIMKEGLPTEEILGELSDIGSDFPVRDAVRQLTKTDCYNGWQQELRYFLFRYEEHLAKLAGQKFDNVEWGRIWMSNPADSIEHILPQSSSGSDFVHWIGNLIILPPKLNSKLGALAPRKKAQDYTKSGLFAAQEVVDELNSWRRRSIIERETALLEWASEEWTD